MYVVNGRMFVFDCSIFTRHLFLSLSLSLFSVAQFLCENFQSRRWALGLHELQRKLRRSLFQ